MQPLHIMLAVLSSLISATDCLARIYVVGYIPPFLFSSIQLFLSAIFLAPFYKPLSLFKKKPALSYFKLAYFSFLKGVVIFGFLFFGAKLGTSVSVASVISKMCVPFSVILSVMFCSEKLTKCGFSGIILSMCGILCFLQSPDILQNISGFLCFMGFSFFWAVYYVQFKIHSAKINALEFNGWVSFFALPQAFIISLVIERNEWHRILDMPLQGISWLLYLSIIGFLLNTCIQAYLIKNNDVGKVTPFILLVPVFGILESVIFLKEEITPLNILSSLIIITGLCMLVLPKTSIFKGVRLKYLSFISYLNTKKVT